MDRSKGMETKEGMRVWLATEDYPPKLGGLSRWSAMYAETLRGLGASVTVLARRPRKGGRSPRPGVIPIGGRGYNSLRHLYFRSAVRSLAGTEGWPDLILCSTWRPAEGALLARPACPVAAAVQGLELFTRYNPILELRRKVVLSRLSLAAAGSRFTARRLAKQVPRTTIHVGVNGVDTGLFTPEGPEAGREYPLQMISVGRLVPRKGFDMVIEALGAALASGVDAGLWIVGSGPLEDSLRRKASIHGGRVRFLGEVDDAALASLYRSADLFVSPCMSNEATGDVEGFGLTFIEASACGTAVAGLAEGGVTDAVEDGVSGILTDRAGFVPAVASLCREPARLAALGRAGRERAERDFDIRRVVRSLLDSIPHGPKPGRRMQDHIPG